MTCSLLLSVGCSGIEDTAYRTPISIETLSAYKEGAPINNKLDAVIVGQRKLWSDRTAYVGEIKVVFVDQMSLTRALKRIRALKPIGWTAPNWTKLSDHSKVWLVIFEGEWQLIFPMPDSQGVVPTLEPPYHGCEYSLFTANDGRNLASGGILCPSEN